MPEPAVRPTASPTSRRARRLLRYLMWSALILAVLTALCAWLVYQLAAGKPDWYEPLATVSEEQAQSGENRLTALQNWAGARYAYDFARQSGIPKAKEPETEFVLTLSQEELNAMFAKWHGQFGGKSVSRQKPSDLMRRPMVHIAEGQLILAGDVPALGDKVISVAIRPAIDQQGRLFIQLERVKAGSLPLPDFVWGALRKEATASLQQSIAQNAASARFDAGGAANGAAVSAILSKEGLDILDGKPTENLGILPILGQRSPLAVRIKSVQIDEGQLTLVLVPAGADQRDAILHDVRESISGAQAMPSTRNTR